MTTKIDPVSTIVDSFPIPELSIIGDLSNKPTYHSLLKAQNELNTNAAAVDTTQGTGIHGLLVLTMSVTEFHTMVGFDEADPPVQIRHPIPVNPGALPADPTAAQLRTHADRLYHHQTHHSTDKALKKILLAAVPDLYISAIKHPRTGYATTTTLMILNHLWATYGEIKPEDLDQNTITMTTTWHPTSPIENLFLQIDDGIAFALAGESPIDDGTAVRIIYKIVLDTGVFELPCRDWRAKPRNEKTLANFKTFFQAANNDRATTTSSAGYHSASAAITPNDTLVSLLEAHNKLQKTVEQLAKQHNNAANNKSTAPANATATAPTTSPKSDLPRNLPRHRGYCHTHGITLSHNPDRLHTSATCRKPAEGHKHHATESNKLGGNEREWVLNLNK